MKKTASPFSLFAATCLVLALSHASPFAQTAPQREQLPNVDKRVPAGIAAQLSPAKAEALGALQSRVPGIQPNIDPLLKRPTYIGSSSQFLTGPQDLARGVATNPEEKPSHRVVSTFLNDHAQLFGHGAEVLAGAKISRDFTAAHNEMTTTVWQQELDGIPLFKTLLIGHVTKKGELVNLSSHFLADVEQAADEGTPNRAAAQNSPAISAATAIVSAATDIGNMLSLDQLQELGAPEGATKQQRFNATAVLNGETVVELVWLPMNESNMRLAWQVLFTSRERGEMYLSVVDAQTGEVMVRHGLTEFISDATYNVYTSDSPSPLSPGHSTPSNVQPPLIPRTLVTIDALSLNASPSGWINDGDQETLGNNVHAHLDRDDNNQPDLPRPNGGANRVFDFSLDLTQEPSTYGDAAVVNLFYWNNLFHDKLYDLGFTEAAGNFQTDNFGRGGLGGDPVQADAQDGLDLPDPFHQNNANMSTPPDGFSPRMQMYKFPGPNPDRDGDLDAEVILHEHAHGLSNRRVGGGMGLFNLQSRGMGEGWSDFYGLVLLAEPGDDINATYAVGGYLTFQLGGLQQNYYYGIRRYPYSTDMTKNPLTFKDIDPAQASTHPGIPTSPIGGGPANAVHNQGEVWCVTLWDARALLIAKHGFSIGNQLILQLVTDGMNLTPANPTFLQARDGILLADQVLTGGANQVELWAAFARRGMGALAGSPASTTTADVIESYDVPGLAYSSSLLSGGNGNGIIDFNECNNLQITLTNIGAGASNITVMLTTTTPEVIVAQAFSLYPNIPTGGSGDNFSPFRISTSPTFVCGTDIELALVIKSDSETRTNFFRLPSGEVGTPVRFNNNTVFSIPDNNPVGASSPIVVSNFNGTIGKVTVALHITHTFTFDLQLLLISPDGTEVILSQNNGGAGDNYGINCNPDGSRTQFDDDALRAISGGTAPFVGVFQPDQPLSTFNLKSGTNANGTWQLKVVDQIGIDTGAIQCWSLFLSPQSCTDGGGECPGSDLAVTMTAAPNPAITFSNLTYTITVTNHGPSGAKSVVLSQTLPPNVIFVSATNSQGTAQHSSGTVTCNLGLIPARGSATVNVVVTPTETGFVSSTATAGSSQTDPDPSNNSVTLITRVVPESADLGVTISDAPDPVSVGGNLTYTISVTNRGPTTATSVRLTNALPSTAAFISTSSTQGSFVNTGGTIIYSLGDIENAGGVVVTIVVRPIEVGSIFATSHVVSDKADLFPGNNSASTTTTVTPSADLALSIVDSPDPAVVGADITYSVTLTNRGPNSAPNVTINGILPSNGSYVSSDANLIVSGNTFSLAVAESFSSGSSLTFFIIIKAPDSPAELTLSATASASQADPNLANNSANATTTVAAAAAVIAPDGSTLITESFSPANGSLDLGETVDVALRLRNVGNISTADVTATLLAGNGIVSPSGPQSYGIMTNGSAATSRTFRFTANGTNGQPITATLLVQDSSGLSTNVNFSFTLPTTHTFSNTNLITIFNMGPANPYPSLINVSGVTGLVDQVKVTLNKINHTYPDDIDILLVDPTGRKTLLMSDAGGANQLNNTVLTFDSTAATALADSDQLVSGNFRPGDYTDSPADFFTNAPAAPFAASLDVFAGTAPNGAWSLYVVDDTTGDLGNIAAGWSLSITTIKPVNKIADITLAVTAASVALVNETVSYTYFITNNGPDTASNVTLSSPLPPNAAAISSTFTNVGDIGPGSNATVTVTLTATAVGLLTHTASIFASEVDLNLINNSATAVTAVGLPAADLGISISADPTAVVGSDLLYTIVVTNNGSDTAYGVVVTNRLPATTAYVSASTPVSVAGGVVTCALGAIGSGNTVSFTITATALAAGNITNIANVVTTSADGNSANNSASVVTLVANPAPIIIASGTHLDTEDLVQNSSVDPGETVTISLALVNVGTANTANLVATLLATGGVAPSSTQNYGILVNNGPAVSRPFTFTASGVVGGTITATLQLQDGANNLGTVAFTFDLPQFGSFTNATAISIPNSGPATPYPSIISVTGANGVVSKVTVGLKGLTHTFPDDLDILLVSPGGQKVLLMSDVGGSYGLNGVNLTFDSAGPELPDAAQIISSIYRPTGFEPGELLAPPAPGGAYATSFTIFNGSIPNGDWSLYVNDDTSADFGRVSGGWTLSLTTVTPINQEVINTEIILSALVLNGQCHLTATGQSGKTYRIEASADLLNWTSISTNVAANGVVNIVDPIAPNPRFYRAVLVP